MNCIHVVLSLIFGSKVIDELVDDEDWVGNLDSGILGSNWLESLWEHWHCAWMSIYGLAFVDFVHINWLLMDLICNT